MLNAKRELPSCASTRPAIHGAMMPEKLANPFCRLDHLPAIAGPASVWVMAQWFDEKAP